MELGEGTLQVLVAGASGAVSGGVMGSGTQGLTMLTNKTTLGNMRAYEKARTELNKNGKITQQIDKVITEAQLRAYEATQLDTEGIITSETNF